MSLLVRLYPASWRERYGDEMAAVLADRPPGPFDVADLLLGALDAHLHLRGLGNRSEHRKGIPMSLRLAGLVAIIGGALWTVVLVLASLSSAEGLEKISQTLLLVAGIALLAGVAGLSAFQFRHYPGVTWVSFLLPVVGLSLMTVGLATHALTGQSTSGMEEGPFLAFLFGLMLTLIGSLVFAIVTIRTRALSRIAAAVLAAGAIACFPALLDVTHAPAIVLVAGGLFGLGWMGLGLDAIRRDRAPVSAGPAAA
jgi:hypothetical protein